MVKIGSVMGGLLESVAAPSQQAGIMTVPAARALLILALISLFIGAFLMIRLQFSRYEQVNAVRWSVAACFVAVIAFGTAAVLCGQPSL